MARPCPGESRRTKKNQPEGWFSSRETQNAAQARQAEELTRLAR
jgi:hypothetical protein